MLSQDWANRPSDVLIQALDQVSAADCWNARQISSSWAGAARQVACFEVVIKVPKQARLVGKVQALKKRQLQQRIPHAHVAFLLEEPLCLQALLALLQKLSKKVRTLQTDAAATEYAHLSEVTHQC